MSAFLFPNNISGLSFGVVRSPEYNTGFQRAASGIRSVIVYQVYPLIHFELTFELLRDDIATSDLKALGGLFGAMMGRGDTFLFTDPDFNTVPSSAPQTIGTGTGSTATTFQLLAGYGNAGGPTGTELVQNVNGSIVVYDNGSAVSAANYTVGPTGIITFGTGHAPASGHTVAWSGSFYYRCSFDEDNNDFTKFMNQWWETKVQFTSVIL